MVPVLDSIDHCSSPRGSAAEALAHNAWFLQEASGAQESSARGGVDGDVVVLVAGQPYRYLLCVSLSVLLRCLPSQHARAAACGKRAVVCFQRCSRGAPLRSCMLLKLPLSGRLI